MTNLEHYFENLLYHGEDIKSEANKNALTEEQQKSVEQCAQYVIYSLFGTREHFDEWIKRDAAPRWVRCEDELPDEVGSYIVYAPTYIGGSSSAKECKAGVMFARWLKGGHWSIEVGYYKRPGCVTHWMSIEPPKEEEHGN